MAKASKAAKAKKSKEKRGSLDFSTSFILSDRAFKERLHVKLTARQGRALRAVFEGMRGEEAMTFQGREVSTQEDALRLILDRFADSMEYPRMAGDQRPLFEVS